MLCFPIYVEEVGGGGDIAIQTREKSLDLHKGVLMRPGQELYVVTAGPTGVFASSPFREAI